MLSEVFKIDGQGRLFDNFRCWTDILPVSPWEYYRMTIYFIGPLESNEIEYQTKLAKLLH